VVALLVICRSYKNGWIGENLILADFIAEFIAELIAIFLGRLNPCLNHNLILYS